MFSIIICIIAIFFFFKLVKKGTSKIEMPSSIRVQFNSAVSSTYMLVALLIICFTANVLWGNIISWLDSFRTPEGMLSLIGGDPILADIISYGSPSELGIPTSPLQPDAILMLENVSKCYHNSLLYLILGVVGLLGYIWSLHKKNRSAYFIIAILGVLVFLSSREAAAGIVHIAEFCFSGVFNPYTGDISGSIVVGFVSVVMGIWICICTANAISKSRKILEADINAVTSTAPFTHHQTPTPPSFFHEPLSESITATKECPYCGETVLAIAKKCKHCKEFLPEEVAIQTMECPICGEDIPDDVEICPICKEPIK